MRSGRTPSVPARSLGAASIITVLVLALLPGAASASALYWANNPAGGSISRVDLGGTLPVGDFITGGTYPSGIAVDATYVYWANYATGDTIGRANLDGTGANQSFVTGLNDPRGLAVDGRHVYWTSTGANTIGRADLDGTNVDQSFITGAGVPQGVAVGGGFIYWTNTSANTIGRANLDGTGVQQAFITGASAPAGVAVDDTHLYWTNTGTKTIGRAGLDGSGVNQAFVPTATGTSSDNGSYGVAVDGAHLYWTNWSPVNTIGRANLDGTGVNQGFVTMTPSGSVGYPFGVAVHAARASSSGADFGDRLVGAASPAVPVVVRNSGTEAMTVSGAVVGATGTHAADFAVATDGCTGRTLAPGDLCQVGVRFTPSVAGAETGTLVLTHDAPGSPQSLPLTGSGFTVPAGPAGGTGAVGDAGPAGSAGAAGAPAPLVVVAYRATYTRTRVTVRYALSRPAAITLKVRTPQGRTSTLGTTSATAGLKTIRWNRRIAGKRVPAGRYRLTVSATADGRTASSTISVRLR